jgi:hypothetical protein
MIVVRSVHTHPRRRLGVGIALGLIALVATALPAFGHASFPGAAGFGFQPNTMGGTGEVGSAPPYVAGSSPTIFARVPFERDGLPHNGSDDTTVDVNIIVPDGWTDPVCGEAETNVRDVTTNDTNQPGDPVAGWSCEILSVAGHDVVHFSGPQVVSPATADDSAQFFSFRVRTPSPVSQTTYNGTGGTEGFIIDQEYASGVIEHWIPHLDFPGTPPPGSETTVAGGLARTVGGVGDACNEGATGPFTDVSALHTFCDDIAWMLAEGIAGGFSDGSFHPTDPVTRQAEAAFMYRYAGEPAVTLTEPFFGDVPESHAFYDEIQWMAESGLSTGTPNPPGKPLFNPTGIVSRQALAAFIFRYAEEPAPTLPEPVFADVSESNPFYDAIQWMADTGLSTGTPNPPGKPLFKPTNPVSRQATSAFIHRFDELPS